MSEELEDLYDAEYQLAEARARLADTANGEALRAAFSSQFDETRTQIRRLEEVFVLIGSRATRRHCAGMRASSWKEQSF